MIDMLACLLLSRANNLLSAIINFFIFQKLEDRFNEKETQNVQRQGKLKVIDKAFIWELIQSFQ